MDEYIKGFEESDIIKNVLKDYINKLIICLEQDYELQDYILVGHKIKYKVDKYNFNTTFTLAFPNDLFYAFAVNLNIDDLPNINAVAIDIKYNLIKQGENEKNG